MRIVAAFIAGAFVGSCLLGGLWWGLGAAGGLHRTAGPLLAFDPWTANGPIPDLVHGDDAQWNAYKVIAWNAQQSMLPESITRFLRVPSANALDGESSEAFTGDLWSVILFNNADSLRAAASVLSAKESAALVQAAGFHELPDLWAMETRANLANKLSGRETTSGTSAFPGQSSAAERVSASP